MPHARCALGGAIHYMRWAGLAVAVLNHYERLLAERTRAREEWLQVESVQFLGLWWTRDCGIFLETALIILRAGLPVTFGNHGK